LATQDSTRAERFELVRDGSTPTLRGRVSPGGLARVSFSSVEDLTAVLLCGGKGERLRPFTEHCPKPLVPLAGKPMLQLLTEYLIACGVQRFVYCVGYKAEMIHDFLAAHFPDRERFRAVDSGDATMTDRLADARVHVPGRALVCYGDTLANVNLNALLEFHAKRGAAATLTTYPLQSPYGVIESDDARRIRSFREKPVLPFWINIGFLVLEPEVVATMERGSDMPQFLDRLAAGGRLFEFRHEGSHLTVNTEKERAQAEQQLAQMFTVP
jgi:NDP-sugar pyrophosphorylase family protein